MHQKWYFQTRFLEKPAFYPAKRTKNGAFAFLLVLPCNNKSVHLITYGKTRAISNPSPVGMMRRTRKPQNALCAVFDKPS